MAHYIVNLPKSLKIKYFIYLKPTLFLWATQKKKKIYLQFLEIYFKHVIIQYQIQS
jgi:hypothetical protein